MQFTAWFVQTTTAQAVTWKIGRVTTELVIRQIAAWRDAGMELRPVSINFSSMQLSDEGYLAFLKELLDRYRVSPEWIEIEITESCFVGKTDHAIGLFEQFKTMGIKLLMDDFGTGYYHTGVLLQPTHPGGGSHCLQGNTVIETGRCIVTIRAAAFVSGRVIFS